eukprot:scaffold1437_cov268-Pinguiococcus_pyrenoidosus.AAC.4
MRPTSRARSSGPERTSFHRKVAEELLDCCLEKGSQDNMTALIVQFPAAVRGQVRLLPRDLLFFASARPVSRFADDRRLFQGRGVQGIREDRDARAQEEEEQAKNGGRHMLTPKATPSDGSNGYSPQA